MPLEAAQHALAIPDEERAIRLIEPIVIPYSFRGQRSIVLGWLNTLPKTVIRAHPSLYVYYASLLMLTNQFEAAAICLREAEAEIGEKMPDEQARLIQGYILTNRSTIAFFSGDLPLAIPFANQALKLLPETESLARAGNLANAAHFYQITGDMTLPTEHAVMEAVALIRTLNNPFATVSSIASLARLYVLQGRLRLAAAIYAQITQFSSPPEALQTTFSGPYYYFGLGDLLREWYDLEAAEQHLQQGMALIDQEVPLEAWVAVQGYMALAGLHHLQGNASACRATLNELNHLAQQRHFAAPLLARIAAGRARLELAQGNLTTAYRWAETCGLSPNDSDLSYSHENEYLTLARVYITQKMQTPTMFSLQKVLLLLERLLREAETSARQGSVLEILMIRALALEAQGDQAEALATLEQALLLAETEGYVRLFVEEGPPMQAMLHRIQARNIVSEYVATLLNAFGEYQQPKVPLHTVSTSTLTESLTRREHEVLSFLLEGASNREIAGHLMLSVNTVKRHVYNLCGKLGVQSRMQAIRRARSLNLI